MWNYVLTFVDLCFKIYIQILFGGFKMEENKITNEVFDDSSDKEVCETKEKHKRKNTKIKFLIWIIIGLIFFGTVGGGTAFCYSESINVNKQFEKGNIKNAAEKVEKINPVTKFVFKNLMMEKLEKSIEINKYSSYDDGNLIYSDAVKEYKQYKRVIDALGVASEESKTAKYINTVIELSKYEKYNTIAKCMEQSSGDIFSALECLKQATITYSNYSKSMYYAKALDHLTSARNKVAGESGYMVDVLLEGINKMMTGFAALLSESADLAGNYGNSNDLTVGQGQILAIINSLEEPSKEIDKLTQSIKSLE